MSDAAEIIPLKRSPLSYSFGKLLTEKQEADVRRQFQNRWREAACRRPLKPARWIVAPGGLLTDY